MDIEGKKVSLELWDTAGQEEYDRVRPLSYPNTDVFLVCFAVTSRSSFNNVRDKWMVELHAQPSLDFTKTKVLLVGTKSDLREDGTVDAADLVSADEGEFLAEQIGANKYVECSARTRTGLKEVFDAALKLHLGLEDEAEVPAEKSGSRLAAAFGAASSKIAELSKAEENALADATVRAATRPEIEVVKRGWLEKKGGSTVVLPDGSLKKERNLKKGGRRNWTRKFFVLLSNGVLLYYKDEAETAENYKGFVQTGPGTEALAMTPHFGDGTPASGGTTLEFVISASNSTSEEGEAESTKASLMLRGGDENDRQDWLTIVKATCISVGAAAGAAGGGGAAAGGSGAGGTAAPAAAAEEGVPPAAPQPEPAPAEQDLFEF
jgi:small GTP-binding protein